MKRIERLIYRFKLLFIIKIHNIILVMHLEFVIIVNSNSYKRYFIISFFVIVDNEKKYEIERLIKKRLRRFDYIKQIIIQYLVK